MRVAQGFEQGVHLIFRGIGVDVIAPVDPDGQIAIFIQFAQHFDKLLAATGFPQARHTPAVYPPDRLPDAVLLHFPVRCLKMSQKRVHGIAYKKAGWFSLVILPYLSTGWIFTVPVVAYPFQGHTVGNDIMAAFQGHRVVG